MEYIVFFVVGIIIFVAAYISESRALKKITNKLEQETWIPNLDYLYKEPGATGKHQHFIQSIKELDKPISRYTTASYMPSEAIFLLLFKHTNQYPKDALGHERFVRIIGRIKNISSETLFKQLIEQANKFPENNFAQERLIVCVEKGHFLPIALLDSFIKYLDKHPIDSMRQKIFLQGIDKIMLLSSSTEKRQGIYNKALQLLEENPSSRSVKQFVLVVGRWHLGKSRPDGKVSIYDEQMIQNDILVRVSNGIN